MENNQYKELFLSEAQEILTSLNAALIHLEKQPSDQHCFDEIFRHCHTLKGMASAMGYDKIVELAHAMEHILDKIRKLGGSVEKTTVTILFEGLDSLEALVEEIQTGKNNKINTKALVEHLQEVSQTMEVQLTESTPVTVAKKADDYATLSRAASSVRISLERIEALMNVVGELTINKIRLVELANTIGDKRLIEAVIEMERIANRLQNEAMQIRLIPLDYLLRNFSRMIRDAAKNEGKEVNLTISGSDIGLDRTVLDEINDPLIHILRNAVCHGIESPADRQQQGKPIEGEIKITAHRERNFVVLDITDDGAGLDKEKIKNALVKQGRMTIEELEKMSDEEIFMLVTLPGFSLSHKVTEESGRGVGMSVVRNKVESIGGAFSIQSQLGKGCTITLRLPLTTAIIHVLLVGVASETCAIPLANITETTKISPNLIKHVENQHMISYRGGVLPLIDVKEKLGFKKINHTEPGKQLSVVVCEIHSRKIGFVVDQLIGEEEIVVKNLTGNLREIRGFSGATILGSGRVAMILDMLRLTEEEVVQC